MWSLKLQGFRAPKSSGIGQTSGSGGWVKKKLPVGDGDVVAPASSMVRPKPKNNDFEKGCVFWAQPLEF